MRFAPLLALGLTIVSFSAQAQNAAGDRVIASQFVCTRAVPCEDRDGIASTAQWAAMGSACIREGTGISLPQGVFDEIAGLSASKCLTPRPNVIPKGVGPQLEPVCCITEVSAGSCRFHCGLVQQ